MGDVRFREPFERVKSARDPLEAIRALDDEALIMALAFAPFREEPYLTNVLATEAMNRARRGGLALQHAADGVLVIDADGRGLHMNPAGCGMVGWTLDELRGARTHDLIHHHNARGEAVPMEACPVYRVMKDGAVLAGVEDVLWRKDGSRFPALVSAARIERDGVVEGAVVVFADLTERRAAEEAVRAQARVLDALPYAVIATDLDGRVTYWNAAAEALYGWSAREVLGRPIVEVTPTAMSRAQAEAIMARLAAGETWRGRFPVRDRAGREFDAVVTNAPVRDESGRLVGVLGVSEPAARAGADAAATPHADVTRRDAGPPPS